MKLYHEIVIFPNFSQVHFHPSFNFYQMNMKAQPVIAFPITKFGKQNRSFQASWYINWPLLQYDANKDCALCFYCSYHFISTNLNHLFDPAFVVNGMRKWNKAREKFDSHQATSAHRD